MEGFTSRPLYSLPGKDVSQSRYGRRCLGRPAHCLVTIRTELSRRPKSYVYTCLMGYDAVWIGTSYKVCEEFAASTFRTVQEEGTLKMEAGKPAEKSVTCSADEFPGRSSSFRRRCLLYFLTLPHPNPAFRANCWSISNSRRVLRVQPPTWQVVSDWSLTYALALGERCVGSLLVQLHLHLLCPATLLYFVLTNSLGPSYVPCTWVCVPLSIRLLSFWFTL
jgi:hypothetical protein